MYKCTDVSECISLYNFVLKEFRVTFFLVSSLLNEKTLASRDYECPRQQVRSSRDLIFGLRLDLAYCLGAYAVSLIVQSLSLSLAM